MNKIDLNKLFQKRNGINIVNFSALLGLTEIKIKDNQRRFWNVLDEYKKFRNYTDKYIPAEGFKLTSPEILLNSNSSISNWFEEFSVKVDVSVPKNTRFMFLRIADNNIPKRMMISYDFSDYDDFFAKLKEFRKGNIEFVNNVCPNCGKKIRTNAQNFRANKYGEIYQLYHLNCGATFKQNDLFARNIIKQINIFETILLETSLSSEEEPMKSPTNKRFTNGVLSTLTYVLNNTKMLNKLSVVSGVSKEQLMELKFQIRNELKENNDSKLLNYLGYAFEKRYLTLSGYGKATTDNINLNDAKMFKKYFSNNVDLKDSFNIVINIFSDNKEIKIINQLVDKKLTQQNVDYSGEKLKNIKIVKEEAYNVIVKNGKAYWFTPKVYDVVQGKWFKVGGLTLTKKFYHEEEPKLTKEEEKTIIDNVKKYEKAILLQDKEKEHLPQDQVYSLNYYVQQV